MLPALHRTMEANGRLDTEVLRPLAIQLGRPLAELVSAASFYHYFQVSGHEALVCTGPTCALNRGAEHQRSDLAGVACPGLCDQAPAGLSNGRYQAATGNADYLRSPGGEARSKMALFADAPDSGTENLRTYRASGGYRALHELETQASCEAALATLQASGLRGRGGAAYPMAAKWAAVRDQQATPKYVVCNADEGEPGTFKDRAILHLRPHLLLEAMAIAGRIVGSNQGIIYLRFEYPEALKILAQAIAEAQAAGLLSVGGQNGTRGFEVHIRRGAGSYVCGEETALLNSLEGRRPWPRERPPYPTERGLWGRPTLVNNVETLANVPPILRKGAAWFQALGLGDNAGTKLYSLSGNVVRPGNYELPLGTTARSLIYDYGGGPMPGDRVKAFTLGGISGGLLGESELDLPLDYRSPQRLGYHLGSGGVIVLDETACVVDFVRTCLEFYQDESCGKCFPCRLGTGELAVAAGQLASLQGSPNWNLESMDDISTTMRLASACGLGQSAPLVLNGLLTSFAGEVADHLGGLCPAGVCGR